MKYVSFHIENYKAIENISVSVSKNVIPLIGINESGKTTILQSILAFDKTKDHLLKGSHVDPKNRYKTPAQRSKCKITALVEPSTEDEAQEIIKEANVSTSGQLYSWCQNALLEKPAIRISRVGTEDDTLSKAYILEDAPLVEGEKRAHDKLLKAIVKRLPNILYFDDFSDRVPEKVQFPKSYYEEETPLTTQGSVREWQDIIKEVFDRALGNDTSLISFCNTKEEDERANILDDVAEVLNAEIITEWEGLKKAHARFDEAESNKLKLSITANAHNDYFSFSFKVQDAENEGHNRRFNVIDRSKGFQWFFNFIMKLKFNPKYKEHPNDAIYLLDEPGSYLHSSAQEELLKKLVEISMNNTILFCTHSQYLLDPETINLGDVRIVEKKDGAITISNYGESSVERTTGAYSALNDALHLKYGMEIGPLDKALLLEGVADWCFYKMFFDLPNVTIIPGAGCQQLKSLISVLIASSEKFLIILDSDKEGNKAYENYLQCFEDAFEQNAYQYAESFKKKSFTMENILESKDIKKIEDAAQCEKLKSAVIKLYYDGEEKIAKIRDGLGPQSKQNLQTISSFIEKHFD